MEISQNTRKPKAQYEKKKFRPDKTIKWGFGGIVIGGIIGILGFSSSFWFWLSPFVVAVLGLVAGLIWDKKKEIEKNKQIFRNKP